MMSNGKDKVELQLSAMPDMSSHLLQTVFLCFGEEEAAVSSDQDPNSLDHRPDYHTIESCK